MFGPGPGHCHGPAAELTCARTGVLCIQVRTGAGLGALGAGACTPPGIEPGRHPAQGVGSSFRQGGDEHVSTDGLGFALHRTAPHRLAPHVTARHDTERHRTPRHATDRNGTAQHGTERNGTEQHSRGPRSQTGTGALVRTSGARAVGQDQSLELCCSTQSVLLSGPTVL